LNKSLSSVDLSPSSPAASRSTKMKILPDGTYATETVFTTASPTASAVAASSKPPLRHLILNGDYFLASVLSTSLTKLILRLKDISAPSEILNSRRAEGMLIMTSIIRVGQSEYASALIDEDSIDRINLCLRTAASLDDRMRDIFVKFTRQYFSKLIQHGDKETAKKKEKDRKQNQIPVDQIIQFPQFKGKMIDETSDVQADLKAARGASDFTTTVTNKLNRIVQLTGFSDPVYAEALVEIHQYDILLDILIVNQTMETLQNLNIEFGIVGDLKLMERPVPRNMGPHSFHSIKANIKVSSTETGVLFGNIVYDGSGVGDSRVIILNDIRIDIMDYISPAECTEAQVYIIWSYFNVSTV
jgi:coatomer subunit beta